MSDVVRIRAHQMRDALALGRFGLEMVMAVGRNYEVSKQAALTASRGRKCGPGGMLGAVAGTRSMITRLPRLQIGHVVGDGHFESSAGICTSSAGCVGRFGTPSSCRHWSSR